MLAVELWISACRFRIWALGFWILDRAFLILDLGFPIVSVGLLCLHGVFLISDVGVRISDFGFLMWDFDCALWVFLEQQLSNTLHVLLSCCSNSSCHRPSYCNTHRLFIMHTEDAER